MPKTRRTKKTSLAKRPSTPESKVKALMQRLALIQDANPAAKAFPFGDYLRSLGVEDVGEDMEAIARDIPEHFEEALKHWEIALPKPPVTDKAAQRVARLKEIIDRLDADEVISLLVSANLLVSSGSPRGLRHVETDSAEWIAMWLALEEEFGDVVQSNDGECWQYMGSEGDEHSFRHRFHPDTQSRLYVTVRHGRIIDRVAGPKLV